MSYDLDQLGGTVAVARMAGVAPPSATAWRKRGIPAERCHTTSGRSCSQGRPTIDVTRQAAPAGQQEVRDAA